MAYAGGCHCGGIRYQLAGEPKAVSLCHCVSCRRSSGAPAMAWAEFDEAALAMTKGDPKSFNSSGAAVRSFCPDCGTGLFYRNPELLPGLVEVQLATLDESHDLAPTMQIQTAERLGWMTRLHEIAGFERFPE